VLFTKRSLRNLCGKLRKEQIDDDVRKIVDAFDELGAKDPEFMFRAVKFDTTYRTNLCDMPFGLFVGVNNHFRSIILAGVMVRDEQVDSFEWVF
jgi:hypothetical protein